MNIAKAVASWLLIAWPVVMPAQESDIEKSAPPAAIVETVIAESQSEKSQRNLSSKNNSEEDEDDEDEPDCKQ